MPVGGVDDVSPPGTPAEQDWGLAAAFRVDGSAAVAVPALAQSPGSPVPTAAAAAGEVAAAAVAPVAAESSVGGLVGMFGRLVVREQAEQDPGLAAILEGALMDLPDSP